MKGLTVRIVLHVGSGSVLISSLCQFAQIALNANFCKRVCIGLIAIAPLRSNTCSYSTILYHHFDVHCRDCTFFLFCKATKKLRITETLTKASNNSSTCNCPKLILIAAIPVLIQEYSTTIFDVHCGDSTLLLFLDQYRKAQDNSRRCYSLTTTLHGIIVHG